MDDARRRRWRRVDELFGQALELAPEERDAFLARACDGDDELLGAVRSLLAREAEAARLLGEGADDFAPSLLDGVRSALAGDGREDGEEPLPADGRIGPWRVLREIGRGGMGTVFLAERADGHWEQRVAIKRVKRGMDTDEVLERFRHERRILASLEHPNIARLYDGGAAADGRPYLVMEYVDGEPITAHCDRARLTVDERLALFERVCEAVLYAHRKLVVHRDIKPSNVLVGADGAPRLLDFGIAKLLDPDADPGAPRTRTDVRVLTPEYASPEQARGEPATTATDVFALGVVLHELLVGRRPDRGGDGRSSDPVAPSVAVARPAADDGLADVAAARRTSPGRLRRRLAGDLDTIVLEALAADPERRYPSVGELLDDLRRHRAGLPVLARRPTWRYRAGRFARRHRVAVGAAVIVALSLAGGLGTALWQAGRAERERDQAEEARALAERERDRAAAVASFLEGLFAAADPLSPRPERLDTLRVAAFLDRGAARVRTELASAPLVQARMLEVIGRVNRSIGRYGEAAPLVERAVAMQRDGAASPTVELAASLTELGNLNMALGRPADAERAFREALSIRRELLGEEHAEVAKALSNLASSLQDQGELAEAAPLYDRALAIHDAGPAADSAVLADLLNARMMLAYRQDDLTTALDLARRILAIDRALVGNAHPRVARGLNNLAMLLERTGAREEAESRYREALVLLRSQLGEEHPYVAMGMANHAAVLGKLGRGAEADSLFRVTTALQRRVLGDTHPQFAVLLSNHADLLREGGGEGGGMSEAGRLYEQALAINRAAFGERHTSVGIVLGRLGALRCAAGDVREGRATYERALAVLSAALPPGHGRLQEVRDGLERCGETQRTAPEELRLPNSLTTEGREDPDNSHSELQLPGS